jgi:recombinational DNA repair ATPase RecF
MSKPTDEEIEEVKKKIEELNKVLGQTIPIEDIIDRRLVMLNQHLQNMERIMNEIKARQNTEGENMKIRKIELKDYKLFKGEHIFEFSDRLNLISGPCGSGKTILFKAMKESLIGEVPSVKISLEGELDDFKKNLELIFIDEEQINKIIDKASSKTKHMSIGQKNFSAFMTFVRRRATVKKNLPLVMDTHLFSTLDQSNREALMRIVEALKTQVIIFEHDFKEIKGNKEYNLKL